jgi:Co/Zn/Cd efflux system component
LRSRLFFHHPAARRQSNSAHGHNIIPLHLVNPAINALFVGIEALVSQLTPSLFQGPPFRVDLLVSLVSHGFGCFEVVSAFLDYVLLLFAEFLCVLEACCF